MLFQTVKKVKGPKLNLKLVKYDDGVDLGVELTAIDEKGVSQSLLLFTPEGKLFLCGCINNDFGLELDNEGCLVLEKI